MKHGPCIDFGYRSLKVLHGDRGVEIPLGRSADGTLTPESRREVVGELRGVLGGSGRSQEAACALPARGVSLRCFDLPPANREETQRLLQLKVEAEFPLPPAELAWGYRVFESSNGTTPPVGRRAAVVALRRNMYADYADLLEECGLKASFSLGPVAASKLVPSRSGRFCVFDIGSAGSDVLLLENGVPLAVRSISWGGTTVTEKIGQLLMISAEEAEERKLTWSGSLAASTPLDHDPIAPAVRESLSSLVGQVTDTWRSATGDLSDALVPDTIYLCGGGARLAGLAEELTTRFGIPCVRLEEPKETARSAVGLGLRELQKNGGLPAALGFQAPTEAPRERTARKRAGVLPWLGIAALLLVASVSLRYAIPFMRVAELKQEIEDANARLAQLPSIDRELDFLQTLEKSQLPALDIVETISVASPKGTQFQEITISRSGSISIQGTLPKKNHLTAFRKALLASGWIARDLLQDEKAAKKRWQFRLAAEIGQPDAELMAKNRARAEEMAKKLAPPPPAGKSAPAVVATPTPQPTVATPTPAAGPKADPKTTKKPETASAPAPQPTTQPKPTAPPPPPAGFDRAAIEKLLKDAGNTIELSPEQMKDIESQIEAQLRGGGDL